VDSTLQMIDQEGAACYGPRGIDLLIHAVSQRTPQQVSILELICFLICANRIQHCLETERARPRLPSHGAPDLLSVHVSILYLRRALGGYLRVIEGEYRAPHARSPGI
jgi:hypothetical protein